MCIRDRGKVKAQPVRLDQGARLVAVVAQDALQRRLQQMGRRVATADGLAALFVDGRNDSVVDLDLPGTHHAVVQIFAALILLDIRHFKDAAA